MDKTKIDWADSTWNIVTGCHHRCEYCYARGIARRFEGFYDSNLGKNDRVVGGVAFSVDEPMYRLTKAGKMVKASYPYGFTPTFHRHKLSEYKNKKGRTIFVCSMGDLFGDFIPDEWIKTIFYACADAPQHRYLFLTKNPGRYAALSKKGLMLTGKNIWYGYSVTGKEKEMPVYDAVRNVFISIEPLLHPINENWLTTILQRTDWIIVGAESGNGKDVVVPNREWVDTIAQVCERT